MRDILGLSGGALIALVSLILQPWTPLWYGGMLLAGILFVASASHLIYARLRSRRKASKNLIARAPQPPSSRVERKSAPEAIEAFAERALLEERDQWKEKFEKSYVASDEAEKEIRKLEDSGASGPDDIARLEQWRRRLRVHSMGQRIAGDELRRAWDAIRDDIEAKLRSGSLVAKGFRSPHAAGASEIDIEASEWRVLSLDNVESKAMRKGGDEIIYVGVAIGRSDVGTDDAEGRKPLWKALAHVRNAINDSDSKACYPAARAALRQAALDGAIHIYGHKSDRPMGEGGNYSMVSTLIPQLYWETADIGPLATDAQFADRFDCLTFPHRMSAGKFGAEINLYTKCTVIWDEVQKLWP
jgi:hypothetical protein